MTKDYQRVKSFRKRLKQWAVECCGGKCRICAYSRTYTALDFHHIDPSNKSFTLSANTNKSHSKFREEAKKCILLCANCHREVEAGVTSCVGIEPFWIDLPFLLEKEIKPIKPKKDYNKVDWANVDLLGIWGTKPTVAIAKDLGVSDNAVRKRAKKLGII